MCDRCLTNTVDMSEGIETEIKITYCKQCNRYGSICMLLHRILTSSKHWVLLERESVEELGLMLKMIKGLDKVLLIHSKMTIRMSWSMLTSFGQNLIVEELSSSWS